MSGELSPIYCGFGWAGEEDSPELLAAVDALQWEQDEQAFKEAVLRAAKARAIDADRIRITRVLVDWDAVSELFYVPTLEGTRVEDNRHPLVRFAVQVSELRMDDRPATVNASRAILQQVIGLADEALEKARDLDGT